MIYKVYKNQIDSFIHENEAAFMNDLDELMSIPSDSENIEEVRRALLWCIEKARKYGLKAEAILDNQIGIIEIGEGSETAGMLAHVDVVPSGDEKQWTYPPYKATLADGYVWGRGSVDDKGPLLNCLYAMLALKSLDVTLHKKIQLIIGTQEEVKWTDIEAYVENCRLPDYSFTPDGDFPIGNREKGYVDVKLSFERKLPVKGSLEILELSGGPSINSVPNEACAVLRGETSLVNKLLNIYISRNPENSGRIEIKEDGELIVIKSKGLSVHSSFPEKGINAIWILGDFLHELDIMDNGAEDVIRFIREIAHSDFEGVPFGLNRGEVFVNNESMHKTMMSLNFMESSEDKFEIYYNIRQTFGTVRKDIEDGFDIYKEKYNYDFAVIDYMDAIYVDSNRPFVRLMEEIYENNTQWKSGFSLGHGTSYAKALPNTVYWGPVFPDEEDTSHEIDERVKYKNLVLSTKLFSYYITQVGLTRENLMK